MVFMSRVLALSVPNQSLRPDLQNQTFNGGTDYPANGYFFCLEVCGYMEEVRLARELGYREVAISIIVQVRQRVRQIRVK